MGPPEAPELQADSSTLSHFWEVPSFRAADPKHAETVPDTPFGWLSGLLTLASLVPASP